MILLTATTSPYDITQGILAQYPLALQDGLTAQIPIEEVKVLCFPNGGYVGDMDVILPLSTFGNNVQNMKVMVVSFTNGTINVAGATPSGGSQESISYGDKNLAIPNQRAVKFEVVTSGVWTTPNL
jgi:hypothetical protein